MLIRAIREVMAIETIHTWSPHPQTLAKYKADIQCEFGIPVVMARSKQEAVEQADILGAARLAARFNAPGSPMATAQAVRLAPDAGEEPVPRSVRSL